jgi:hypothetical protein
MRESLMYGSVRGARGNSRPYRDVQLAASAHSRLWHMAMVKDATADYSDEEMHAALDINIPNYASAIVTTDEIVDSISALSTVGIGVGH